MDTCEGAKKGPPFRGGQGALFHGQLKRRGHSRGWKLSASAILPSLRSQYSYDH